MRGAARVYQTRNPGRRAQGGRMRPARLGVVAALLATLGAGPAARAEPPPPFEVDDWSASWAPFVDDFEDGLFPDGDPGEVTLYHVECGVVTDAQEAEGRLRLEGPGELCDAQLDPTLRGAFLSLNTLLAGGLRLRARFDARNLPVLLGSEVALVGFGVFGTDGADGEQLFQLIVGRDLHGRFFLSAFDEAGVRFGPVLPPLLPSQAMATVVEIELTLVPDRDGARLEPTPQIRICDAAPSDLCGAWTPLLLHSGSAGIPADLPLVPLLFALTNGDQRFVVDLLDWEIAGPQGGAVELADAFEDGVLGRALPYASDCLALEERDGLLRATPDPQAAGCDGVLAPLVALPDPKRTRARFRLAELPRSCEGFGVGFGGVPDAGSAQEVLDRFVPDLALLTLFRGPMPDVGDDVLAAFLLAEEEGDLSSSEARPIARLVLSDAPASDPDLAHIEVAELELALRSDGDALAPQGWVRLCDRADCVGGPDFRALEPWTFPQDVPGLRFCGSPAASLAPPVDGGVLSADRPHAAALFFAPEAGSGAAGLASWAALAALAWWRRRKAAAWPAPVRLGTARGPPSSASACRGPRSHGAQPRGRSRRHSQAAPSPAQSRATVVWAGGVSSPWASTKAGTAAPSATRGLRQSRGRISRLKLRASSAGSTRSPKV